jgi:hypothetical protein
LPSFGSFKNNSANAPTRKVDTSVRLAFSRKTKIKQRVIMIRPRIVVFGSFQRRSIITAPSYPLTNLYATSTRYNPVMQQGLGVLQLDVHSPEGFLTLSKTS